MENSLVYKSNKLVEARYSLNLNEQKVLLYAITKLDKDKPEMDWVELDLQEITELTGTQGKRYEDFRATVRSLRKREVIIDTDDEEFITGWLSSIRFYKHTGIVKLKFGDGLAPYLLQLQGTFTRYQLKNVMHIDSKYSIRLYELLKQYEGFKEPIKDREFSIDDLRDKLGIAKDEYDRMFDLEKRVLKVAMKEINQHTDIKASYEKIKQGRKIAKIKFTVEYPDAEYVKYLEETYDIADIKSKSGLDAEKWNSKQIVELYTIACQKTVNEEVEVFEYIRLNYLHMLQNKSVQSKFAYLKKALDNDYAVAVGQLRIGHEVDLAL